MAKREGKDKILEYSTKFLTPQLKLGLPAYALADPFQVDIDMRMVTLGFECLISGYEGKGTDYVYFDQDNKIYELNAVRHTGGYNPNAEKLSEYECGSGRSARWGYWEVGNWEASTIA